MPSVCYRISAADRSSNPRRNRSILFRYMHTSEERRDALIGFLTETMENRKHSHRTRMAAADRLSAIYLAQQQREIAVLRAEARKAIAEAKAQKAEMPAASEQAEPNAGADLEATTRDVFDELLNG